MADSYLEQPGLEQPGLDLAGLDRNPLRWRSVLNSLLTGLVGLCVVLTLIPLALVLGFILVQGFQRLNLALLTELPPPPGFSDGGIANAMVGTVLVCAIATALALPLGVLAAIYLAEFSHNNRLARWVRFAANVLSGVPSIIAGVFVYGLLVQTGLTGFSAVAGGVALALLMLPTIIRTTDDALQLVPDDLRWASLGAGASDYETVFRVVLPASASAIATGVSLAIARAAGETAPLIFTALFSPFWPESLYEPIATLSVLVYNFAIVPFKAQQELAWAASLVLMMLVLLTNIISRWVTRAQKF
jgi:phosphate transport system permease protein